MCHLPAKRPNLKIVTNDVRYNCSIVSNNEFKGPRNSISANTLVYGDNHVFYMRKNKYHRLTLPWCERSKGKRLVTRQWSFFDDSYKTKVICLGGNNITPKNGGPVEAIRDTFDHVKSLTNTLLEKNKKVCFLCLDKRHIDNSFTGSISVS